MTMLILQRTVAIFDSTVNNRNLWGLSPSFLFKAVPLTRTPLRFGYGKGKNSDSEGTERAQNSASYTAYKDLCGGWGLVCVCIA